jgi:hypothetical protein
VAARGFAFWVEDDRLTVRMVSPRALGNLGSGHAVGGDYRDRTIRLHRGDTRRSWRSTFCHELGHYLVERQELQPKKTTEEEICDLLSWLPGILADPRNDALLAFLGLKRGQQ